MRLGQELGGQSLDTKRCIPGRVGSSGEAPELPFRIAWYRGVGALSGLHPA